MIRKVLSLRTPIARSFRGSRNGDRYRRSGQQRGFVAPVLAICRSRRCRCPEPDDHAGAVSSQCRSCGREIVPPVHDRIEIEAVKVFINERLHDILTHQVPGRVAKREDVSNVMTASACRGRLRGSRQPEMKNRSRSRASASRGAFACQFLAITSQ